MTIETIQNHPVYKQVIADSCGGMMYNVANRGKYESAELLSIWDSLSSAEREAPGGIMRGAMSFLQGS